ncbi:SDR family NAD(P)-dependent oxidoreductase [Reinekea thalattae]|nr:SDR family NAD(P)-dependent oxidoreductase [Reinekea thalattae]
MKKILLTGATDGIGLETAKQLAAQGHYLLIHGRSESKLADTEKTLKQLSPNATIESYRADLSSFSETRAMLNAIVESHSALDIIINNAGVYKTPEPITTDGFDIRFVVNTLAPYIIAQALLPTLADDGRIINLSSAGQAPVNLAALAGQQTINDPFQAYAESKLAITMWSIELAESLKPEQVILAVNPGSLLASKMVKEGFGVEGHDLKIGADILVRAALSAEFNNDSGKYFDNDAKQLAAPHADALDVNKRKELIKVIETIIEKY